MRAYQNFLSLLKYYLIKYASKRKLTYKYFIITLALVSFIHSSFANDEEKSIEVEFNTLSKEEVNKDKPNKINEGDLKMLLKLIGLDYQTAREEQEEERERMNNPKYRRTYIKDIQTVQMIKSQSAQQSGETFVRQIRGFAPEALTFYAAIGASMVRKAQWDSIRKGGGRGDPRWMENLLHEMTSPIGVFSFFCFVIASGQTSALYSKLLRGIEFKKGFFKGKVLKGFRIGPLMQPISIHNHLKNLRHQAMNGGWPSRMKYKTSRVGIRFAATLGGPLGMSAGMMASNMIHELDYLLRQSFYFKRCRDDAMKSENAHLSCSLFWDETFSTFKSWGPGLFSLVTASFISHALVNGAYTGTYIAGHILKGVTVRVFSRIPIAALQNLIWLMIPVPAMPGFKLIGKILSKTGSGVGHFFKSIARQIRRPQPNNPHSGYGFRLLNLYAFMEIDQMFTHGLSYWLFMDGIKSRAVSGSISNLLTHHNVDNREKGLICANENPSDCQYHPAVLSAHNTTLQFDTWRTYQTETAQGALYNWLQYVSIPTGSFEHTYYIYKELFKAREKKVLTIFNNQTHYFGYSSEDSILLEYNGFVQDTFKSMLSILDAYLKENKKAIPNNPNVNVVSPSPSRFLKPKEEWDESIKYEDPIFILHTLFGAVDPKVDPIRFYGNDWYQAIEIETKKVKNSILNPDNILNIHFDEWEKYIKKIREAFIQNEREAREALKQNENDPKKIITGYFTVLHETIKNYKDDIDRLAQYTEEKINNSDIIVGDTVSKKSLKTEANETVNIEEDDTLSQESEQNIPESMIALIYHLKRMKDYSDAIEEFATLVKDQIDAINETDWNNTDLDAHLKEWDVNLKKWDYYYLKEQGDDYNQTVKQMIFQNGTLLDNEKMETKIKDNLRKKVLSAGIEYLEQIIGQERTSINSSLLNGNGFDYQQISNRAEKANKIATEIMSKIEVEQQKNIDEINSLWESKGILFFFSFFIVPFWSFTGVFSAV